MKSVLVLSLALASTTVFAKSIDCGIGPKGHHSSLEIKSLTLKAKLASATELQDVELVLVTDEKITDIGVAESIEATPSNPRKLKKTNFFVLDLDEKGTKRDFSPYDQCNFTINLPKDIASRPVGSKVTNIHMLAHCDQNGGLDIMTCEIK